MTPSHAHLKTYPTHLGSIDELVCQALCNGLDVPEGSLPGTGTQQPDGLQSAGKLSTWPNLKKVAQHVTRPKKRQEEGNTLQDRSLCLYLVHYQNWKALVLL